ncbi:MAG: tRNA (adenosine(37)-N6)-threonylcarbamoyltransferase complex dimerization subunit type 1 TsaB [Actinobacteria bacterium]|nr:MAG: tRNA (adenosine(37)-N6)-threonylcarbamoyltransferase complex dimerization subunit type 1 TsaB [Actinomycetota bacterium]
MLTLAFDTATNVATSALLEDGDLLGERAGTPKRLLEDVDELLTSADAEPGELERIVVGIGPGSFTSLRMGLAASRTLAFALDAQVAGVSTLEALAAGAPAALPVIDARRREVFTLIDGEPVATPPAELGTGLLQGRTCVGDGAVRYRDVLEAAGARVPPDDSELHIPRASVHARLAREFGPAELVEPIYVRVPDADRTRK